MGGGEEDLGAGGLAHAAGSAAGSAAAAGAANGESSVCV